MTVSPKISHLLRFRQIFNIRTSRETEMRVKTEKLYKNSDLYLDSSLQISCHTYAQSANTFQVTSQHSAHNTTHSCYCWFKNFGVWFSGLFWLSYPIIRYICIISLFFRKFKFQSSQEQRQNQRIYIWRAFAPYAEKPTIIAVHTYLYGDNVINQMWPECREVWHFITESCNFQFILWA